MSISEPDRDGNYWSRGLSQKSAAGSHAKDTRVAKDFDVTTSLVMIVDDDEAVREGIGALFRSLGYRTALFSSTKEFLDFKPPAVPGCIILDVRLPGANGLDFQLELKALDIHYPIVFMTGHGDITMTVKAMKAGAINFLSKPVREQDILDAVTEALTQDRKRFESSQRSAQQANKLSILTPRERQIMDHAIKGLRGKEIAAKIGVSEITVKVYRARLMKKLGVYTLADLIKLVQAQ